MKCLQCNNEAELLEEYKGIPVYVCIEGHRTGIYPEEPKDSNNTLEAA